MLKPFSSDLYDADNPAINNLMSWLNGQGWSARSNPDPYGVDVLAVDSNGKEWEIEVEVKHNWLGATFPYEEVHFSARKLKFTTDNSIFVMFNSDRSYALGVRGSIVRRCEVVKKDTIYTKGEAFIAVPLSYCRFWRFV